MEQQISGSVDQPTTRIRTVSATEAVVQRIMETIESGALAPGARLPSEEELSVAFGVGRSSIREAKRLLMAKNILETRSSRGTFVCERTSSSVLSDEILHKLLASETLTALQEARELIETIVWSWQSKGPMAKIWLC